MVHGTIRLFDVSGAMAANLKQTLSQVWVLLIVHTLEFFAQCVGNHCGHAHTREPGKFACQTVGLVILYVQIQSRRPSGSTAVLTNSTFCRLGQTVAGWKKPFTVMRRSSSMKPSSTARS